MSDGNKSTIAHAIRFTSINLLVPLIDKYPILKEILNSSKSDKPADDWDFFMTAAGCGLVLMSTETYKGEHDEVKNSCIEIDKNLPRAIDDFTKFMNNFKGKDEEMIANIGYWVLWNVKQSQPTYDDMKELSPIIGNFLMKVISDWRNGQDH